MNDDPMKCACRSDDPRRCYLLRYPNAPDDIESPDDDRERCECCCHQEYYDRLRDEYDDMIIGHHEESEISGAINASGNVVSDADPGL